MLRRDRLRPYARSGIAGTTNHRASDPPLERLAQPYLASRSPVLMSCCWHLLTKSTRIESGTFWNRKSWGASTSFRGKTKMRTYLAIAAAAAMITSTAIAQPANRDANTPAVNTPNTPPNPGAPVAGSNSFTEGQAKSRIEFDRLCQCERATQRRSGRLAWESRQGRQERHGEPRLSGQRHGALARGRHPRTNHTLSRVQE